MKFHLSVENSLFFGTNVQFMGENCTKHGVKTIKKSMFSTFYLLNFSIFAPVFKVKI